MCQTSSPEQCPVQEESEDDSRALSRKQKTPACTVAYHEPLSIGEQESATATCDEGACKRRREDLHDGSHDECRPDGRVMVTTRRRHQYQPDEEERDDPNGRWVYQDDWQGKVDISALDGMAIDDDERLEEA